jgi:hypothetical protein
VTDLRGWGGGIRGRESEIAFEAVEGAARPSAIAAADPLSGTRRPLGKVAARLGRARASAGSLPLDFAGLCYAGVTGSRQNRSFKSVFTVIRVACTGPWKLKERFPSRS